MSAVGYIRVSTAEQVRSGLGLEAQRARISDYCRMRDLPLLEVYADEGVSGGSRLASRPAGAAMLADTRAKHVILAKLDRGFRNAVDCMATVDEWERRGVTLHIVDLGGNAIDTAAPAGRFMLTVLAAAAEMERGLIRDRIASALAAKRAAGCRLGGAPYGWANVAGELVEVKDEQAVIRRIRQLSDDGLTARRIAEALNTEGLASRLGRGWGHTTVAAILRRGGDRLVRFSPVGQPKDRITNKLRAAT